MRTRHMALSTAAAMLLSFALAPACADDAKDDGTTARKRQPPPRRDPPPRRAAPKTWKEMTKKERAEHMKTVVLPKMKTVFQAFDAKKFADVTCMTCHGEGAKQGIFKMPNPKLPKLSMADRFKKHDQKWVGFMMMKVVPEMANALGVPKFDPKTGKGFGCGGCHEFAK